MNSSIFSLDVVALKKKTLFLTFISILIASVISQILISRNFSNIVNTKIEERKDMAALLYNRFINESFNVQSAIIDTTLNTLEVKKAIELSDRDNLRKSLSQRYKIMATGYPYINVLHFVQPDNVSFLRMHSMKNFGDDLSAVRPMHVRANKKLESLHGMEIGRYGISLRSVSPIIYDGIHYGTLEVGIALENVVKELSQVMDIEILLTLQSAQLQVSLLDSLEKYNNQSSTLFASKLFKKLHPKLQDKLELHFKDKEYILYKGIDLYSFNSQKVGQFFYAIDVSKEVQEKQHYILVNSLVTIALLLFIYIILNINFSKMSKELQRGERYSKLILDTQKNIVILTNGAEIIDANQSFLDFFKYDNVSAFKSDHECVCDFFQKNGKKDFIQEHIYKESSWSEYIVKHPEANLKAEIIIDNEVHIFSLNASCTRLNSESLSIIVFTDITPLMDENANLYRLSHTDKLTQLHNRHSFETILKEMHNKAQKSDFVFSIIFFDIDHFKKVNDTYGHAVGDDVLQAVTSLISSKIRSHDIFARWGGEEFIVILPEIKKETTFEIAQKLRIALENHDIELVGKVTCSFGVSDTLYSETAKLLIEDADLALYKAKEQGRNQVVLAGE